jgi:hypothetical protein
VSAEQAQRCRLGKQHDIWSALGEGTVREILAGMVYTVPWALAGGQMVRGGTDRGGLMLTIKGSLPDLHEGAVEERSLGDDEVGAETTSNGLLGGSQLLLGKFQAQVQLVQVTPETG